MLLAAPRGVAVPARHPRGRVEAPHLALHLLRTGARRPQRAAALHAGLRQSTPPTALMADEQPATGCGLALVEGGAARAHPARPTVSGGLAKVVQRERDVAGRARRRVAARAEQEAGETTAVEEEDRLLVAVERLTEGEHELLREEPPRAAHIYDLDLGKLVGGPDRDAAAGLRHRPHAAWQIDALELVRRGGIPLLRGGSRGAEQQRRAGQLAEPPRHLPRVVAGSGVLLLIGPLVRLVDDDQAEVRQRREDRRARADHHVVATPGDCVPLVEGLAQ